MNGCFTKPCLLMNSIEQLPGFQSDDVNNFCSQNRECLYSENTKFYQKQSPKGVQVCNFIKKETLAQVFSCEFCQISKNTSGGCFCFMAMEFFIFHVKTFQFSKFHENVGKLHKGNFNRGLSMTFKVKNS